MPPKQSKNACSFAAQMSKGGPPPKNPLRSAFFGFASALKSQTSLVTSLNNTKQLFLDFASLTTISSCFHNDCWWPLCVLQSIDTEQSTWHHATANIPCGSGQNICFSHSCAVGYLNSKTRDCGIKLLQTRKEIHSHKDPSNIKKDNVDDHGHDK